MQGRSALRTRPTPSWRDWSTVNGFDLDYTGADLLYRVDDGEYGFDLDTITQEVRLVDP